MFGLEKFIQDTVDEIQTMTKKLNNTRMERDLVDVETAPNGVNVLMGPPAGGVQTALAGSRPHDDGGLPGRREPHHHIVAGWQQLDQIGEFLAHPPQAGSGSKLWLDVQKVLTKNCELDK
jgi:hypothetical protein